MRTLETGQKIVPFITVRRKHGSFNSPHECHPRLPSTSFSPSISPPHTFRCPCQRSPRGVFWTSPQYELYLSPSYRSYDGRHRRTTCGFYSSSLLRWLSHGLLTTLRRKVRWNTFQFVEVSRCHPTHFGSIQQHAQGHPVWVQDEQLGLLAESASLPDDLKSGECSSR